MNVYFISAKLANRSNYYCHFNCATCCSHHVSACPFITPASQPTHSCHVCLSVTLSTDLTSDMCHASVCTADWSTGNFYSTTSSFKSTARILPAPQHVSLVSTAVTNVVSSVVKLEPQTVNKSQSASTSPLRVPQYPKSRSNVGSQVSYFFFHGDWKNQDGHHY